MKRLLIFLFLITTACATSQPPLSPMLQCKSLCANNKVQKYKDDTMECHCNIFEEDLENN